MSHVRISNVFIISFRIISGFMYKAHVIWALIRGPAKIGAVARHFGLCGGILHNAGAVAFWGSFWRHLTFAGARGLWLHI